MVTENSYKTKRLSGITLGSFEIADRLGRGRFGVVHLARHKSSGWVCAIKTLKRREIVEHKLQEQVKKELEVQSSLQHPGIVRVWTWIVETERIHVVMEYCIGGDLYGLLQKEGKVKLSRACSLLVGAVQGLAFLHEHGIVHRDVKAENVLLRDDGTSVLADLGWCAEMEQNSNNTRLTLCGTLDYLSPEAVRGEGVSFPCDVWACGVLLWELLTGDPPFAQGTPQDTHRAIVRSIKEDDVINEIAMAKGLKAVEFPPGVFVSANERVSVNEFLQWIQERSVEPKQGGLSITNNESKNGKRS